MPTHAAAAESARLLGVLVRSAPRLVLPYTAPVLRALVSKLRAASSGSGAAAAPAAAQPSLKTSSQGGCLGGRLAAFHALGAAWHPTCSCLPPTHPPTPTPHRPPSRGRV